MVTEVNGPGLYLVQDALNDNLITTTILDKMVVKRKGLTLGETVYRFVSPADLRWGRLFTSSDLKLEYAEQLVLDRQHPDGG